MLAPLGVAYLEQSGQWVTMVKPYPADIDEWTHFLRDASNNAVANDTVVGPPKHLQWVGGPKWGGSHDRLSSSGAMGVRARQVVSDCGCRG